MSCMYSFYAGENPRFNKPADNWQACMTLADYVYIPLNATLTPTIKKIQGGLGETRTNLSNCVTNEAFGITRSGVCSINNADRNGFNCLIELVFKSQELVLKI